MAPRPGLFTCAEKTNNRNERDEKRRREPFFLELSLPETPSLLILNGLRMIAGSRGAIRNDAAVMVGRPIRSRSFLFGKLVPHHSSYSAS